MSAEPLVRASLSPAQRDLLLETSRGERPAASHVVGTSIALGTGVDLARWQAAAHAVFRLEPGMRLRLGVADGAWFQEPDPTACLLSPVVDLAETSQETVTAWVSAQLAARPAVDADASFVHALVKDRTGGWHAVLMAPHVFVDGHACRSFFERTAAHYAGETSATPSTVGPLFEAFHRAASGTDVPETLAFWKGRLAGVSPLVFRCLPEDPGEYVDHAAELPGDVSAAVEAFCEIHAIHPADFFLGVYALVLERLRERGEPWIVHAIRSTRGPAERALMGCFYRAMPIVVAPSDVALSASVSALLTSVAEQRRTLRGQMRISMSALQDLLPRRSARAIFNFYSFNHVQAFGGSRQLSGHFLHRPDEVHLVVARRAAGFELRVRAHTSVLSDVRLLPRLFAVATQIARGARTVGDCDWLLGDEWPTAGSALPESDLVAVEDLVARHARTTPERTALIWKGANASYATLDAAANRLARRLIAHDVGPGTLVGIHLERSLELIVAILAVVKAGGAFVPVDPDYPVERIRLILADSRVRVLVGRVPGHVEMAVGCSCIPFDSLTADCEDESDAPFETRATLDDPAYVIYTSGSTGTPKGTVVTRRNLVSLVAATRPIVDVGPDDVWTLLHSCAFDFSVWEIFGALASGGRLVIVPSDVVRSPEDLARLIDDHGVTILSQTPSAFFHLAAVPGAWTRTLRYVIFGGEALDPRRLRSWFETVGDERPRLVNMYGITETTVHVTWRIITSADALRDASPIGRPLPGWDVCLVDLEGRPVPRGCAGEIWVGGAGVARGYLDRDDLTSERFIPDPFRSGGGRRLYRSGDLARESADGGLDYLGRLDDQVKVRGYRIELGEIAAVLAQHPAVQDAVVLAHPGPEGATLVGYVVTRGNHAFDEAGLQEYLRRTLPAHMVCARFVRVEAFPLTAHGKLDRKALPMPAESPEGLDFAAPRSATEEIVASLVTEVTGATRVGRLDDFFAVGGHSLAAMRLTARLSEVFHVPSRVSLVFERPTVSQIAEYVDTHRGSAGSDEGPCFARAAGRDALPLTYAQERVWLLQRLFPESVAYNFGALLRLRGRLDVACLRAALGQIVDRHDAYRTTFHVADTGESVQCVHEHGVVSIQDDDFSDAAPGDAHRRLDALCHDTLARPFAPSALPLVEWHLVRMSSEEHVLLHREHHLVHDGWSFVVFVRELLECYRAQSERRPARLPPTLGVGDYAAGHRRWLAGPAGAAQRQYWAERLAGVPERIDLPTDRARPPVFSFRGAQVRFELSRDLVERLRATARREGATLYMLLLGAFSLLLARLSGAEDLAVAAGVANRRWAETEHTIGMLLNNVVFRLRPRPDLSGRDFVRQVRDEVLAALAHQDLPFGDIVGAAGVQRSPAETSLGNVFFSSYEGPLPDLRLPDLDVELLPGLPNGSAKFDWNVIVFAQPGGPGRAETVTLLWEYATDLFESGSIERARRQFLVAIDGLLASLDRPLRDLSLSDADERHFLMEVAEGPALPYPRDATVPELFARQAAARGGAVAVRNGAATITYAELDRRARSVAAGLVARGVRPGEPVALLMPRGLSAVTAMLGTLMAGAAYLPLSPQDPRARRSRLIADAGARVVITEGGRGDAPSCASIETLLAVPAESAVTVAPDALAAVLFTSGSTGEPKGVEVLHRGIVRLLFGNTYAVFGADERILQLAPLSFDASTFEIWGALLHGAELVIAPEDLPTATGLGETIAKWGVTTLWLNGSLFNAIVDEDADVLSPVRQLLIGGEALSVEHVRRAMRRLPRTTLVNGYGPTENTTFSCCHVIPREVASAATSIPIGRPIAHSRVRVLDAYRRLAPAGAVGEIYVGGDGLARGYRHRDTLTAERFVADPLRPGAGLYRTGDLGRLRPDGALEFRGRVDAQVKIRGYRVEPGEVEAALCRLDGVSTASVQLLDDAATGKRLVAFVVPEQGHVLHAAELRTALAEELPPYLLPSRVIVRHHLPTTPHGKLDGALLLREAKRAEDMDATWPAIMAKTAIEGVTAAVFAEVLGRERVDADQDFFEAGGHSLLVLRAIARIERALGVRVEPSLFLHGPTPRLLAGALEARLEHNLGPGPTSSRSVRVSSGDRPLVFVPGGEGGDVSLGVYARLALHLPGVAFHGLRLVDAAGGLGAQVESVEALAAEAIVELLRIQADAAVDLVGGCIGGVVAYEMARQLERAGTPPRSLVLMDTVYPSLRRRARHQARGWSSRVRRWTQSGLRASRLSPSVQEGAYKTLSWWLPFAEHEASPLVPEEWLRFVEVLLAYRPQPLGLPLTLMATQDLANTGSVQRWQQLAGARLSVRTLTGTHWSYIRSQVAESGATLRAVLEAT